MQTPHSCVLVVPVGQCSETPFLSNSLPFLLVPKQRDLNFHREKEAVQFPSPTFESSFVYLRNNRLPLLGVEGTQNLSSPMFHSLGLAASGSRDFELTYPGGGGGNEEADPGH